MSGRILDIDQLKTELRRSLERRGFEVSGTIDDVGWRHSGGGLGCLRVTVVLNSELQTIDVEVPSSIKVVGYTADAPDLLSSKVALSVRENVR